MHLSYSHMNGYFDNCMNMQAYMCIFVPTKIAGVYVVNTFSYSNLT